MSVNDELSAWERSREATRKIMAEMGCDEKGYPLPKEDAGVWTQADIDRIEARVAELRTTKWIRLR